MAAPTVQTRGTPLGAAMPNGHVSKFTIGIMPTFCVWEFEITPGEWDGGPEIPFSSFFNSVYHTTSPSKLVKVMPFIIKGKYDSDVFKSTMIPAVVNQRTAATMLFPNLGTLSVWGWARRFSFGVNKESTLPELTFEFNVSNWDHITHTEAGPAYADGYTGTADS